MRYLGAFEFPLCLRGVARELGEIRNRLNRELMDANPRMHRGPREAYASEIGILGELIARHHLCERRGETFEASALIDNRPLSDPDILVDGSRIDVKTIREDAPDMLVNAEAHAKAAKQITHYWFVKLLAARRAEHFIASHAEVASWPTKHCRYTAAHFRRLDTVARRPRAA